MRIPLPKLPERRLKIVCLHWHIIVIGGRTALALVEVRGTTIVVLARHKAQGIRAAMVHIIAQQIASTAQLDDGHRVGILGINVWTAMVGSRHTSAQFTSEIRILTVCHVGLRFLLAQLLGGDGGAAAESLEVESLVIVAHPLLDAAVPETVGIVAIQRYHLAIGHRRSQFGPSRAGVEGKVEASLPRHLLQSHQITPLATVFVVKLSRYDRATVFPLQTLHLGENLAIKQGGIS